MCRYVLRILVLHLVFVGSFSPAAEDSDPIARKKAVIVTGAARAEAIYRLRYRGDSIPVTEAAITKEYFDSAGDVYRFQNYRPISGFPVDIVTPDDKRFFYIESDGRLVELFPDPQNNYHYGAAMGPVYPELNQVIQDRLAEEARRKKESEDSRAKMEAELESWQRRTLRLRSTRTFPVRPSEESIQFSLGETRCSFIFENPSSDKFWEILPFEAEVEVELRKTEGRVEPILKPRRSEIGGGWKISCDGSNSFGKSELYSEVLKTAGLSVEREPASRFFPPKKPNPALSTFQIRPIAGAFEHLAPGSKIEFTRDVFFPPTGEGMYLLIAKGPIACRLRAEPSWDLRKIDAHTNLFLESSKTFESARLDFRRVWSWKVSGLPGVDSMECSRKRGGDEIGLSTREVQTVLASFGEISTPDGMRFEPLAVDWKTGEPGVVDRRPEEFDFRTSLPRGAEVRFDSGNIALKPGERFVELIKPEVHFSCVFAIPADPADKQKIVKGFRLVVTPNRFSNTFTADLGAGPIPVDCGNYGERRLISVEEFRSSLKPEFSFRLPPPVPFGWAEKERRPGSLSVVTRYRDCGGKTEPDLAFFFRKNLGVDAGQSSLDLGNGCTIKFSASQKDREVKEGDTIKVGGWVYKRSVDESVLGSTRGKFGATAEKLAPSGLESLHCEFESRFEADIDLNLACDTEFIDSLSSASESENSSVRLDRRADRAEVAPAQGGESLTLR